ncbi:hypothetical protein HAX54_025044 [Datura stramonium]|uniref:Glucan endo-1,3-beta-D-glucosidase n=1 Tax=Datura stramonium TaxID=4076 RepID=A0ABS8UYY6_DATST|nr:hypothetical protein [Datura stramonium]
MIALWDLKIQVSIEAEGWDSASCPRVSVKVGTGPYIESRVSCPKSQAETEGWEMHRRSSPDGWWGMVSPGQRRGRWTATSILREAKGYRKCQIDGASSMRQIKMDLVTRTLRFSMQNCRLYKSRTRSFMWWTRYEAKVSYGFNAFFQKNKQEVKACDFDGLGEIVATNPRGNFLVACLGPLIPLHSAQGRPSPRVSVDPDLISISNLNSQVKAWPSSCGIRPSPNDLPSPEIGSSLAWVESRPQLKVEGFQAGSRAKIWTWVSWSGLLIEAEGWGSGTSRVCVKFHGFVHDNCVNCFCGHYMGQATITTIGSINATNISISVTLGNQVMWQANRTDLAYNWVNDRIKDPINKGVNIVELTIGSEPYSNTFLKQATNYQVVKVLKLMRESLDDMGLGYVKTTTAHGMDVLKVTKFPSEADFRDDIKGLMLESLAEFNRTGAPFVLYMFPIHFVKDIMNYTMEFAFFDNKSGFKIEDGNITYTNVVELMIDSVAWAIRKAGYPDMKIMIGQIGWPTDGYPHANIKNAERFHKGLLKFVASKKGTPLRSGPIDIYLHSLSDENMFRTIFGTFQRHWGIYEADGNPKYKIDFSSQVRVLNKRFELN